MPLVGSWLAKSWNAVAQLSRGTRGARELFWQAGLQRRLVVPVLLALVAWRQARKLEKSLSRFGTLPNKTALANRSPAWHVTNELSSSQYRLKIQPTPVPLPTKVLMLISCPKNRECF